MGIFHKKEKAMYSGKADREVLLEIFETIDGASSQLELIKKEYEEVNRYLQDAQIISELPDEVSEELTEYAKNLISLKKDITLLEKKQTDMTAFQFGLMERYEQILQSEILRLKKEEEFQKAIGSDLRKLAGEKGVLLYQEEEEKKRKKFLARLGLVSGVLLGSLLVMYFVFYRIFEIFLEVPFLITMVGGFVLIAYLFFETERNKKELQILSIKMNKLILLTNKIKIKYVNQKASIDYSYDKFAVKDSLELDERYKKYLIFKEDEKKRKKTNQALDTVKAKFLALLDGMQIHDSEVWVFQAKAVVDKKEMVEIRHRLNERRAKLRERLSFNASIIEGGVEKLRGRAEKNPSERRMIYEMAEVYKLKL